MAGMDLNKHKGSGKAEPAGLGSLLLRAMICVCLLSAVVMTFFVVDVRLHTSNLMTWIDVNPTKGFFVFIAFYSVATGKLRTRQSAVPIPLVPARASGHDHVRRGLGFRIEVCFKP